jgi:hypothetical protein
MTTTFSAALQFFDTDDRDASLPYVGVLSFNKTSSTIEGASSTVSSSSSSSE